MVELLSNVQYKNMPSIKVLGVHHSNSTSSIAGPSSAEAIMFSLKTIVLAASLFSTVALACPIIERDIAEGAYVTLEERQSGCPAKYNYDQQGRDWGSLCAG